ncbi:MAG: transfer Agent [Fulvimarina sp.]|nr:transfer Agent [Fulvimarina sp.]
MAVNRRRGEVSAIIDGKERRLCLTLGALAELEDAFAADDLGALAQRFQGGRLSARDLTRIIGAGLRGGGAEVGDEEVARMQIEGAAAGAAAIAVELLAAAFGSHGEAAGTGSANPPVAGARAAGTGETGG